MQGKFQSGAKYKPVRKIYYNRIIIFIIIICAGCCVGALLRAFLLRDKSFLIESRSFYFCQVSLCGTLEKADEEAEKVRQKGDGGYIVYNGNYLVMSNAYDNRQNAEKEISGLKTEGINAGLHIIESPEIKIEAKKNNEENLRILNYYRYPLTVFEKLSNLKIEFDNLKISELLLKLELKLILNNLETIINELNLSANGFNSLKYLYKVIETDILAAARISGAESIGSYLSLACCSVAYNYSEIKEN